MPINMLCNAGMKTSAIGGEAWRGDKEVFGDRMNSSWDEL